tara:strand:+ start:389 stop:670 length:282 start_codon:yes stop_codon:yes gene_type:complete
MEALLKIDDKTRQQIDLVAKYCSDCDDWVTIKKEIMKGLPSGLRKLFSRRDPITKEQRPNNFDHLVINYYKDISGIELVIRTLKERREMFDVL